MTWSEVEFTLGWLGDFLDQVARRWSILPMGRWHGQDAAILRHDIDLDLEPALRMAQWEQIRGFQATHFVLTTSDCYNPFSATGRRMIQRIQECGGEIGLHFDPTLYPAQELQAAAESEATQLARVTGRPVTTVSLHCPHRLESLPLFTGFTNAYDSRIFGPTRYLSDSSRRFRNSPEEFLKQASGPIQLLFHPLHFQHEEHTYPEIFRVHVNHWLARIDQEHRAVNHNFRDQIPLSLAQTLGHR
ncbi:hypothetical protein IV102_38450 [bacterium]|nr:hypothetical protein [bacterium]